MHRTAALALRVNALEGLVRAATANGEGQPGASTELPEIVGIGVRRTGSLKRVRRQVNGANVGEIICLGESLETSACPKPEFEASAKLTAESDAVVRVVDMRLERV